MFSSLEPELQDKLRKNEKKSTALVPLNYQPPQFVSDQAKMTANFRLNIVLASIKFRKKYSIKKQADSDFLDLYNSGLYLPKAYKFIGSISLGMTPLLSDLIWSMRQSINSEVKPGKTNLSKFLQDHIYYLQTMIMMRFCTILRNILKHNIK